MSRSNMASATGACSMNSCSRCSLLRSACSACRRARMSSITAMKQSGSPLLRQVSDTVRLTQTGAPSLWR